MDIVKREIFEKIENCINQRKDIRIEARKDINIKEDIDKLNKSVKRISEQMLPITNLVNQNASNRNANNSPHEPNTSNTGANSNYKRMNAGEVFTPKNSNTPFSDAGWDFKKFLISRSNNATPN